MGRKRIKKMHRGKSTKPNARRETLSSGLKIRCFFKNKLESKLSFLKKIDEK